MQFFGINTENIPSVQKASSTSLTWSNTNNGTATVVRVGGQSYSPSSTITLNTGTVGFNGIDAGSLASNSLYYLYATTQNGVLGLIISLAGPSTGPAGFTSNFRFLGKLRTDFGGANINTVAMDRSVVPQRADAEEWQSYTPTLSSNPWGTGASLGFAQYRRVGSAMDIRGRATMGTGTGANLLVIPLPSGFTIVGRGTPTTDAFMVGNAMDTVNTTNVRVLAETGASTTNLYFSNDASTNAFTKLNANAFGDGQVISWNATVDIAEWAGLYT
jgi:hypothetical protein